MSANFIPQYATQREANLAAKVEALRARLTALEAGIERYTQPLSMSMCANVNELTACALGDRVKLRALLRGEEGRS